MDILDAAEFDFSAAARQLQVTSSQLGKFLKLASAVWQLVSAERKKRGLRPLIVTLFDQFYVVYRATQCE